MGLLTFGGCSQDEPSSAAPQNPSPMVENTRDHQRIDDDVAVAVSFELSEPLESPIQVYLSDHAREAPQLDMLLHFHGAGYLVAYAAEKYPGGLVAAAINLGAGSSRYDRPFQDPQMFPAVQAAISAGIRDHLGRTAEIRRVWLSGFSAGYGAIRRILREGHDDAIAGILLLDGLHAGYGPAGMPMAEGGVIDSTDVIEFVQFAREAAQADASKRFLITHSSIFPGTYASTTEVSDHILAALGLKRQAVMAWGPLGMQQLSFAGTNRFAVMGFAGNTAPDHLDHVHALYYFLESMTRLSGR